MNDVSKLPKWAQDKIEALERNVRDAELAREQAEAAAVADDPTVAYSTNYQDRRGLPAHARVTFTLAPTGASRPGSTMERQIGVRLDGDALEIMGGRAFLVEPRSSNSIRIYLSAR